MAFVLKDDPARSDAFESAERLAEAPIARMTGVAVDEGKIRANVDARMAAEFRQNLVIGLVPLLTGVLLLIGLRLTRRGASNSPTGKGAERLMP